MKKKVISILLTIFLLSGLNFTVLAEEKGKYVTQAEQLKTLGVFQGSDKGLELDRQPQRLEGLAMLIRLLGKEAEATALKNDDCFFTDVPNWGRGYVNYAYTNGLTVGKGGKLFGSGDLMNAQSYVTFMLRALGYSDTKGDFSYNDSLDFGFQRGLLTLSDINDLSKNVFLRDHIAKVSLKTLYTNIKGSDITLLKKLVSDGSIPEEKANVLVGNESGTKLGNETTDYVKIIDVIDRGGSESSKEQPPTQSNKLYQEYQDKIMNTYKNFNTSSYIITLNEVAIEDKGYDNLDIKLYFDKKSLLSFIKMKENEWSEVEDKLIRIGSGLADENCTDVDVYLIFRDNFTEYPVEFMDNAIYSKPIRTISYNSYEVCYPYVRIKFEIETYEYYIEIIE